jgi:hypothetical protein
VTSESDICRLSGSRGNYRYEETQLLSRLLKKPGRSLPAVAARNRGYLLSTIYRAATAGSDHQSDFFSPLLEGRGRENVPALELRTKLIKRRVEALGDDLLSSGDAMELAEAERQYGAPSGQTDASGAASEVRGVDINRGVQ